MTIPRYALLARKALVEADAAIRPRPAASPASDAATVHAIEAVLRQSARRRTLTRVSAGTFAMAAAAALVFLGVHGRRDASTSTREAPVPPVAAIVVHASGDGAEVVGGHPEVGGDQALPPGARVVALPHGHALLSFASGTHVNIDEGGDVTVIDEGATQILSLAGGALKADVAKLKPGERFLVRTDDAEIEVHGTSFRVARVSPDSTCGAGTRTRLNVFEGVVTIRSAGTETRVTPGGSWPADCSEHPMTPPAAPAPVIRPVTTSSARSDATLEHPASPALPGVAASPGGPGLAAAPPATGSDLTAENDLFAAAIADRRGGKLDSALSRYDLFLSRYPSAPLAETVAANRMALLRETHDPRAAAAARSYLASFPNGSARDEARSILSLP